MGAIGLVLIAVVVWAVARGARQRPKPPPPPAPPRPPTPRRRSQAERDADVIGGWLLGHQVAHGHHGLFGDPLPGGHLGAPQDLAFWGGVFQDDDEDDRDEE